MGFSTDGVNMNLGSINYAYIVGTALTPPASPVAFRSNSFANRTGFDASTQSSIWQHDPATGVLSPQWINSDSSIPKMHTLYAENEQTLVITGDPTTFAEAMGASYLEVTIVCVPRDVLNFNR
ncbi:hypothetical protein FRC09_006034 [Ceratobasidium sp. 395]|nr:hypothetical protein FRC09_006034 [Ceratobasidium sp. 395]